MKEIDKKIIDLISEGKASKEIGKELNRSSRTIEHRIERLFKKFNCKSRSQLIYLNRVRIPYTTNQNIVELYNP